MSRKQIQAKHLADVAVLGHVDRHRPWALSTDMEKALPGVPEKVIRAKLRKLIARGLVSGCACGCSGQYTVTLAGRELLAISAPARVNGGAR